MKKATEAAETLWTRITERLGNPFLFSFSIAFCLREWEFLYSVVRGGTPDKAIAIARGHFDWNSVAIDFWIAVGYTILGPFVALGIRLYVDWTELLQDNLRKRIAEGRLLSLYDLHSHPAYKRAVQLATTISDFSLFVLDRGLVPAQAVHGLISFADEQGEPIEPESFAFVLRESGKHPNVIPFERVATFKLDQLETVFVVAKFPVSGGSNRLLVARNGALLKPYSRWALSPSCVADAFGRPTVIEEAPADGHARLIPDGALVAVHAPTPGKLARNFRR